MRTDLPTGTVTLLFTDIEGSTRLLHELGDRYADALAGHRRIIRGAIATYGGTEVDTQGDAFFAAFEEASDAVAAAEAAQGALEVPVRMGLHTGEPEVAEEGYVGTDVHRAARICGAAHGGQVVVSASTRALLPDRELTDLGEHRLKDFTAPVALYQLGGRRFPPLRTISNTNLPRPASSFVGREREVDEVTSLVLEGDRIVTLTGPGGSGKTRLAIEAAAELVPEFKGGVFWVGLAALRDPALVASAVGQTLGAADGLAEHVRDRELLLVLDNLEHVIAAAPDLASLVERCANLRLLVTSRELLRVRGEAEYAVPPLSESEAAELFCQRARLEPDGAIAELCRRLDNLPLAVELAAARARVLSPAQMLERLAQRLDLLKGGRDAEARQQTLRAAIEWSYDLLDGDEQKLFRRLAVFAGGCTVAAAEEVAEADLDLLQSLVEKSLVRHSEERFWMLETIREYAVERLEASGEAEALRLRHAEFFRALAESAQVTFEHARQRPQIVAPDAANLRSAIAWARSTGRIELALRIAIALELFWGYTDPGEGMRIYRDLLGSGAELPLELRAHALRAVGSCANPAGEDALAERYYEQSYAAFEELGDERGVAELLMRLGSSALYRGDAERARDLASQSLQLARRVGIRPTEALALWVVGEAEQALGNDETGIELIRRSAELAGEIGFVWQRTRMLRRLADRALAHGDLDGARRDLAESLAASHGIADRLGVVFALARLARVAAESGDVERAGLLWGAVEAEEQTGSLGAWYGMRDGFAAPVLAHAGPAFDEAGRRGRTLSLDEAVAEALRDA